ncbi:c-type cytochrome [Basilea psittacipulmonis]|uniref:Cytochrome c domain-containing protein n=1 Tax=Basilea psittacipulmonis DSM 24701 TaxID=1072685 RepID=A0A077DCT3_9BURK|nr:cytochrome c [Basilea psittacipulmonis]AIL32414.1 hypothetical protein IX83_02980 [Basilea psittacipulmonis DSM 24701]
MKKILWIGLSSLMLISTLEAKSIASIQRGKELSAVCAACHMPDGRGMVIPNLEARPRITGLDAAYVWKQLKDFKAGTRENASMKPIVSMFDEEQLKDIANYFASLEVVADIAPAPSQEVAQVAQKLINQGDWNRYIPACKSCHGVGAYGVGEHFPNLNGQPASYLEHQLMIWKTGQRNNDSLHLMRSIANRLSEEEIKALAAWFASQPAVKQ